jgi:hypothetical protein
MGLTGFNLSLVQLSYRASASADSFHVLVTNPGTLTSHARLSARCVSSAAGQRNERSAASTPSPSSSSLHASMEQACARKCARSCEGVVLSSLHAGLAYVPCGRVPRAFSQSCWVGA